MKLDNIFKPGLVLKASDMTDIVDAVNSTSVYGQDGAPVEGAEVFNDYTGELVADHSNAGIYSSAFNFHTKASGDYSFSAGTTTSALGEASAAFGKSTVAYNQNELACGRWNISHTPLPEEGDMPDKTSLFTIGFGTGEDPKKLANAVAVMSSGDVYVYDLGGYNGNNLNNSPQTLQSIVNNAAMWYHVGTTEERTELGNKEGLPAGTQFFDTTVNKVFYWSSDRAWVNADGTPAQ